MTVSWISSITLRISVYISTKTKTLYLFFFDLGTSLPQVLLQICSYVAILIFHFMTLSNPHACVPAKLHNHVQLFVTSWTAAHQASLSMNSPGKNTGVDCHFLLEGIFLTFSLCFFLFEKEIWLLTMVLLPELGFATAATKALQLTTREKEVPFSWLPKASR